MYCGSSGRSIEHIPRVLVYMCRRITGLPEICHVSEHTFSITASGDDVPRQLGAHSPAGGRQRRHLEGGSDAHIRHGLLRVPSRGAIPPEAAPQPLPPRALPHDPAEHQARHYPAVSFSLFSSLLFSFLQPAFPAKGKVRLQTRCRYKPATGQQLCQLSFPLMYSPDPSRIPDADVQLIPKGQYLQKFCRKSRAPCSIDVHPVKDSHLLLCLECITSCVTYVASSHHHNNNTCSIQC